MQAPSANPFSGLTSIIDGAYESRASSRREPRPRMCARRSKSQSNCWTSGKLRVAQPEGGGWRVNEWLKKAVLLSFRINGQRRDAGRQLEFLRQGSAQIQRLGRSTICRRRRARRAAGDGAARRLHRRQRGADAELRQRGRLRGQRHHGRHLGDGGFLRADRQERAFVRRRRHRRRAGTVAGRAQPSSRTIASSARAPKSSRASSSNPAR